MKKYSLGLLFATLIFSFFSVLTVNADVPECLSGDRYNRLTGELCNATVASSCQPGDKFDSITGAACTPTTTIPPSCDVVYERALKVGSRGTEVAKLQQILKNQGLLSGAVDGVYGSKTERARQDYDKRCETPTSVVISHIYGPVSLDLNQKGTWTVSAYDTNGGILSYSVVWGDEEVGTAGSSMRKTISQQSAEFSHTYTKKGFYMPVFTVTTPRVGLCVDSTVPGQSYCSSRGGSASRTERVNVGKVEESTITVLSPKGGETFKTGTRQTIKWSGFSSLKKINIYISKLYECNSPVGATCPSVYSTEVLKLKDIENTGSYEWYIPITFKNGRYEIYISHPSTNENLGGSDFSITDSSYSSVVITGIKGPQTLDINQNGKWTITASDTSGGDLMYAVMWGDEDFYRSNAASNSMVMRPGQSAIFYHRYSRAGVYSPKFTVYNDKGGKDGSAEVSLSVRVGNVDSAAPVISSLSPTSGPVGTQVSINGTGFSYENTVNGHGTFGDFQVRAYSYNGRTLSFVIPSELVNTSWSGQSVTPGVYKIQVGNTNGSSNNYNFTVTSSNTSALQITTASPLPNAQVGEYYSTNIMTSGGSSGNEYFWTGDDGAAKFAVDGLGMYSSYGSSNKILGTPGDVYENGIKVTTPKEFNFKLTVTNGTKTASKNFRLTVDPASSTPTPIPNTTPIPGPVPVEVSQVKVAYPNGGESFNIAAGSYANIRWSTSSLVQSDVFLVPEGTTSTTCTSATCPAYMTRDPYTLAKNIWTVAPTKTAAYSWPVGTTTGAVNVSAGSYRVKVCKSGTDICDSSDAPITIVR